MNDLVAMTAGLLADRADRAAGDPEPLIAAAALLGLWTVHFSALRKYLDAGRTPTAVYQAVTADVDAAAELLRAGLGSFAWARGG
jgi:hypothetical protein